jgi:hypothetical protein
MRWLNALRQAEIPPGYSFKQKRRSIFDSVLAACGRCAVTVLGRGSIQSGLESLLATWVQIEKAATQQLTESLRAANALAPRVRKEEGARTADGFETKRHARCS